MKSIRYLEVVSDFTFRVTIVSSLVAVLAGCWVPERHVPGGPYCLVLYVDYSFRPPRLLGLSRSEAKNILEKGESVGVAYFAANGLLERSRHCWKDGCSPDWLVYHYDAEGKLIGKQGEKADTSGFNIDLCPEEPPQNSVKLPSAPQTGTKKELPTGLDATW